MNKKNKIDNTNHLYYQPKGYWVGDIMPWGSDGKFYLYDQRDNRNPGPFGEPFGWSLATTEDFVEYLDFGDAINKGGEDSVDQFIYAGSVFEANGKIHAFYTGYNRNWEKEGRVSQVLLHADSIDYETWHKSEKLVELVPQDGYDEHDWRDPWVVWDEKNQYYLLILGARLKGPKTQMTGRLVHFISKDLEKWEFKGDFWAPNKYTMFEMPDLFKMGDWWYLVYTEYSEQSKTRYAMSKDMYGPWIIPDDDAFDGRSYYAARTAFDGTRRVLFGWVATKENNNDMGNFEWAGTFVPHEIFQREDATLGVKPVDSLWNSFQNRKKIEPTVLRATSGLSEEILLDKIDDFFSFETILEFTENTREFSFRVFKDTETDESYEFNFSLVNNELSFDKSPCYPWYQMMNKGLERPIRLKPNKSYNLKLIVDNSILTIYIDGIALNARGYKALGDKLAVTVTNGELKLSMSSYSNML